MSSPPVPGFQSLVAARRTGDYDKSGRPVWELTEPLYYYSVLLQCWLYYPVGFRTNYASVPRMPIVWWYCGDRCWEEPVGHDFGYTAHGVFVIEMDEAGKPDMATVSFLAIDKATTDSLFREALLLNPRIPSGMAETMYKAVSWFGQSSWGADSKVGQNPEIIALIEKHNPSADTPLAPPDAPTVTQQEAG